MKTDDKYNRLIDRLKIEKPVLKNPEELTEKIMSSLEPIRSNKFEKIILQVRPWLSAAAIFLIGLFVYQQLPRSPERPSLMVTPQKNTEIPHNNCLMTYLLNHPGKGFFDSYLCYVKETEKRNRSSEQLLMKFQNNL
jgi:hypothetical protein